MQSAEESLLNKKKIEDSDRVQKLLVLHRQRLKEEEVFFEKSSQEAEQKEQEAKKAQVSKVATLPVPIIRIQEPIARSSSIEETLAEVPK
jgi:hypothetical protein